MKPAKSPADPYVRSAKAEARLRLFVAKAVLRAAEAGGIDAAIAELVRITVGQDAQGNPVDIAPRTRRGAASDLARLAVAAATMSRPPTSVFAVQASSLTIADGGDLAQRLGVGAEAWLERFVAGLREVGSLPDGGSPPCDARPPDGS